jgi:multiple sugar transport system substrate-binding protein
MSARWKRIGVLASAAALVAAVATTAAGAHPSSSGRTAANTLNIMGFGTNGDDVATTRYKIAEQAVAPDTVVAPNGGFDDQQFLAAVASGSVPDLVYFDRAKLGTYAAKGALVPLTSCIKSQGINTKQYRQAAMSQVTYGGKVYGIPEFFDIRTIIVNLDVANQAKLTGADFNTKNLAKFKAAAVKMYQHSGNQVTRIGIDPKLPEFFPLWAKAFGVDVLSKDGLTPHLNDPRAVAALTYAVSLIDAQGGYNSFTAFRNTWDFFGSGNQVAKDQVGAWPMESWYYNVLAGSSPNVHIAAIPFRNKIGNTINFTSGSAWAIPKGAKNQASACKWMKTMTSTSTWLAAAKNRASIRAAKKQPYTGIFTGNSVADKAIIDQTYTPINKYFDSAVHTVLAVEKYSFSIPSSPASAEFQTAWMNAVTRVLQGQQSPKQALDQAQKEAVAAIKAAK